jgi:predicted RNA binding protein YcfA (HicA-like mRNA interferase family)
MSYSNQIEVTSRPFFSRFVNHHHSLLEASEFVSTNVRQVVSDPSMNRDRWEYVKVREIIQELERAGWVQIRQTGSRRHFKRDTRTGSVCVAGNLGDDVPKGTLGNIVRQAGLERRPR